MKVLMLSLYLVSLSVSSHAQVLGGAYGFAQSSSSDEKHKVMSLNLVNLFQNREKNQDTLTLVKTFVENSELDKTENKELFDKVLKEAAIKIALNKSVSHLEDVNPLDDFSNALSSLNYSLPENFNQMKAVQGLNQENLDATTYLNKLKLILPSYSEEYKVALETKYQENSYGPFPESGLYLEELFRFGVDQNFLKLSLDSAYFHKDTETMRLIAKYYDFDFTASSSWGVSQPILCDTVKSLEAHFIQEEMMNAASKGYSVISTGSSSPNPQNNYLKELTKFTADKAKTFIELGADPEVMCGDGKSFSDKVKALIEKGIDLSESDFGLNESLMLKENCPGVELKGLEDLCEISRAMFHFERVLSKNEGINFVDGLKSGKCDLTMLAQHIENGQDFKLRIVPHQSSQEVILSGKDKNELIKKIQELIEKSKP